MTTRFKIYSDAQAAMSVDDAGKPYQPCNGTEGEIFTSAWCGNCARDKSLSEGYPIEECDDDQLCKIIAMTMACSSTDDPNYPKEWVFGADGQPCCTAFIHVGDPLPPVIVRDDKTLDMFEESP